MTFKLKPATQRSHTVSITREMAARLDAFTASLPEGDQKSTSRADVVDQMLNHVLVEIEKAAKEKASA